MLVGDNLEMNAHIWQCALQIAKEPKISVLTLNSQNRTPFSFPVFDEKYPIPHPGANGDDLSEPSKVSVLRLIAMCSLRHRPINLTGFFFCEKGEDGM